VRVIAPAWPPAPQSAITAGGNPASGRLVVSAMETSPRRRQTAAVGLASAILAGFVAYGMLFILELFLAGHSSPEILPPPGDWRMRLAVLVIAVIFGVLIALQWRRNRHRSGSAALSAFTVAAVLARLSSVRSHRTSHWSGPTCTVFRLALRATQPSSTRATRRATGSTLDLGVDHQGQIEGQTGSITSKASRTSAIRHR
jgi:multisubunit Na+/H+ antiporter MnhB subunit